MTLPLVSIIIPVYNTEKYVSLAIESVLAQTHQNFELILVNDGSSDDSGKICDDYAHRDSRITVIHQKNSGVASARNAGLDRARGELFQFMDSDDEMHEEKTELLLKTMFENDVDIVFCGFEVRGKHNKIISSIKAIYEVSDFLYKAYCDDILKFIISSSCMCMYKRQVIIDYGIRFNNDFTVGEDGLFILSYLSCCRKIYMRNEVLYHYNTHEFTDRVSIMSCTTKDVYVLIIKYYEELLNIVKKALTEEQKKVIMQLFLNRLIPSLITFVTYSDNSTKDIIKEVKNIIGKNVVHQASIRYKRMNRKHSLWIPIFINLKLETPLYYVLKYRAKKTIERYGKSKYVNSVYTDRHILND